MFREDTDYVKRTFIVCAAIVLCFVSVFWSVTAQHGDDARVKKARYEACQGIRDEKLRRDCIAGTTLNEVYPK